MMKYSANVKVESGGIEGTVTSIANWGAEGGIVRVV